MKVLTFVLAGIVALAVVGAAIAPIGPLPGFFIGGEAAPAPEGWEDTSRVDEILLRVPGALPRVVILWVIEHDGELHVVGSPESGWVTRIGDGSPVDLRIGDRTYPLHAVPVVDGRRPILEAYVEKYREGYPEIVAGLPSLDEAEGRFAVFRLKRS